MSRRRAQRAASDRRDLLEAQVLARPAGEADGVVVEDAPPDAQAVLGHDPVRDAPSSWLSSGGGGASALAGGLAPGLVAPGLGLVVSGAGGGARPAWRRRSWCPRAARRSLSASVRRPSASGETRYCGERPPCSAGVAARLRTERRGSGGAASASGSSGRSSRGGAKTDLLARAAARRSAPKRMSGGGCTGSSGPARLPPGRAARPCSAAWSRATRAGPRPPAPTNSSGSSAGRFHRVAPSATGWLSSTVTAAAEKRQVTRAPSEVGARCARRRAPARRAAR